MFRKTIIAIVAISTLGAAAINSASASGSGFPRNGAGNDRFAAHTQNGRQATIGKPGSPSCTKKPRHFHWYSGYVDSCPKW